MCPMKELREGSRSIAKNVLQWTRIAVGSISKEKSLVYRN